MCILMVLCSDARLSVLARTTTRTVNSMNQFSVPVCPVNHYLAVLLLITFWNGILHYR